MCRCMRACVTCIRVETKKDGVTHEGNVGAAHEAREGPACVTRVVFASGGRVRGVPETAVHEKETCARKRKIGLIRIVFWFPLDKVFKDQFGFFSIQGRFFPFKSETNKEFGSYTAAGDKLEDKRRQARWFKLQAISRSTPAFSTACTSKCLGPLQISFLGVRAFLFLCTLGWGPPELCLPNRDGASIEFLALFC